MRCRDCVGCSLGCAFVRIMSEQSTQKKIILFIYLFILFIYLFIYVFIYFALQGTGHCHPFSQLRQAPYT